MSAEDRYEYFKAEYAPDVRYNNTLYTRIGNWAIAKDPWAMKMTELVKGGKQLDTAHMKMAEQAILQPLDFEPENVMLDGEPADPVWPDVDEEGEGGFAT